MVSHNRQTQQTTVISHVTYDTLFMHGVLLGRQFTSDVKYHVKWAIYNYNHELYVVSSEKANSPSGHQFVVKRITY